MNGERVVVGTDGLPMGSDYNFSIELISPNGTEKITNTHIAGNLAVIGITAQKTLQSSEYTVQSEDKDAEQLLYEEAINYINRWNKAEDEFASLFHLSVARPLPTVVTIGGVIDVTYLLDTPHGFTWKGVFVDADLRAVEATTKTLSSDNKTQSFMQLSGLQGSVLEHKLFEDDFQVESVSTSKLFQLVSAAQTTQILTIDKTNAASILPALAIDENIKEDIQNSVNQNLVIKIPDQEVSYQDWTGIGYIKENSETGEAGWMLSGMIAGGMTAITPEEWANQYIRDILGHPYTPSYNNDPLSAVKVVNITITDNQFGTVNKKLEKPLAVLVIDKKGRPVKNASVTFIIRDGGGNLQCLSPAGANVGTPESQCATTTSQSGIAKADLTLGKLTSANPVYMNINPADEFLSQLGLNLVTAIATSQNGIIPVNHPFSSYGKPDIEGQGKKILKAFGDQTETLVNSPAGNLLGKVVDQYGNPISNVSIEFKALPAISRNPSVPLPATYRNVKLYKQEECALPFPLYGECSTYYDTVSVKTEYFGGKISAVLGDTVNTEYTIQLTAPNLSQVTAAEFKLRSTGYRESADGYIPHTLHVKQLEIYTQEGQLANASKAGTQLKAPLTAELYVTYEDMVTEGPASCTINGQQTNCWQVKSKDGIVKTRKVTDGTVTFTPLEGGGSVASVTNLGNGKYQTLYTTGSTPLKNVIEAWGEATIAVPEVRYDSNTGSYIALSGVPVERQATLKSGQFINFEKNTGDPQTGYCFTNLTTGKFECYVSSLYTKINYTAY
ncbi:MAG: hypothetical protein AB1499_17155, partial [Nitrospirota bacterium]